MEEKKQNSALEEETKISFCLPVYNVGLYIKDCIDSILSQCSDHFLYEIVCIDDCSSDNSYEVLSGLQKIVPQIKLFQNTENKGVSYTRNRAITLAEGKYIWFVDPDDMLYPNVVKLLFDEIEKRNYNVILGNYIICPEDAELSSYDEMTNTPHFDEMSTENEAFLPYDQLSLRKMNTVCCGMFRKDFLMKNNLRFKEKMIAQEDTLFYYEFSLRLDKLIKYQGLCYIYRQRSSSVMHSKSPERSKKYYLSMCILHDTYIEHLRGGDYKNKGILLGKLHHMRQNLAITLASVPDTKFVKTELKRLKKSKLYPYPFRKDALSTGENMLKKILVFLQPIEPFFWLLHTLYKYTFKNRKNHNGS